MYQRLPDIKKSVVMGWPISVLLPKMNSPISVQSDLTNKMGLTSFTNNSIKTNPHNNELSPGRQKLHRQLTIHKSYDNSFGTDKVFLFTKFDASIYTDETDWWRFHGTKSRKHELGAYSQKFDTELFIQSSCSGYRSIWVNVACSASLTGVNH